MVKRGLIILALGSFTSYAQTITINGISFAAGISSSPMKKKTMFDGGYFKLGYSRINMLKPGVFYTRGTEFSGNFLFYATAGENFIGTNAGVKYHFLMSLLSIGMDAEYLFSITSNSREMSICPNIQVNLFTPELSLTGSYGFTILSKKNTTPNQRFSFGFRYIFIPDKEKRQFKR